MQSSELRKRASRKSGSHQRFNINTVSGLQKSPQKSFVYEGDLLRQRTLLTKREKVFVQLPKIYPLHQKLLKIKTKDIQFIRFEDKRFHLKGSKFSSCESQDHAEQSTLQSSQKILVKQSLPIKKNQSRSGTISNDLFYEIVLRANDFNQISLNKNITKIKAYVEEGNNSRLIKELLRKRSGIKIIEDKKEADFVWTRFSDWQSTSKISKFSQTESKKTSSIYQQSELQLQTDKLLFANLSNKQLYLKKAIQINELFIHNHLKNHEQISDKKNLFKNVKAYCLKNKIDETTVIPKTYHVQLNQKNQGVIMPVQLLQRQKGKQNQCFYIVKPGQDTNRGTGITVVKGIYNVEKAILDLKKIGKSSLIQQYIDPLLFKNRKFDIRCYALVTSVAGKLRAYWYKQGYLRTCTKEFSYDPSNLFGHLTNDAVQKKSKDYGKYQQCNKLSYNDLEAILIQNGLSKQSTTNQMKRLATLSIKSVEDKLQGQKNIIGFEIFGYDFLIDKNGKVWLIQINTNPCLQFSGSLLSRIIWHMIENSFRIVLDPYIESLQVKKDGCRFIDQNKYERIL